GEPAGRPGWRRDLGIGRAAIADVEPAAQEALEQRRGAVARGTAAAAASGEREVEDCRGVQGVPDVLGELIRPRLRRARVAEGRAGGRTRERILRLELGEAAPRRLATAVELVPCLLEARRVHRLAARDRLLVAREQLLHRVRHALLLARTASIEHG